MILVSRSEMEWKLVETKSAIGATLTSFEGGFFVELENNDRIMVQYEPIPPGRSLEVWMSYKEKYLPARVNHFITGIDDWVTSINSAIQTLSETPESIPMAHLLSRNFTKGDCAKLFKFKDRFRAWDTALPQFWLDKLSAYAKATNSEVTYGLIRSTTFWCYKENDSMGGPVSVCFEVKQTIENFNRTHDLR